MKTILKLIFQFFVGACIGFLIIIPLIAYKNGEPMMEVARTILGDGLLPLLLDIVLMIVAALLALLLQVAVHEGGHLVAGLLTGYKFVSYRLLSFTLIRKDGRLQLRNFELGGTGGQCLLSPPDKPIEQIDTRWYNAGGVLANLIMSGLAWAIYAAFDLPKWSNELLLFIIIIGIAVALMNGIPMKMNGIANDGYNLFQLEKDIAGKQCFCNILEANARLQEGEEYKDLPDRLFDLPKSIDWHNSMQVSNVGIAVSRLINHREWEAAYNMLSEALTHQDKILPLYRMEFKGLMTLACIATGRLDEAREHYDDKIKRYVERFTSTQSDKMLISMAATLALDGDRPRAEQLLHKIEKNRDKYVIQGETKMAIDLMHWFLDQHQSSETNSSTD